MLGGVGERLREARYLAGDALSAIARVPKALGRGAAAFWSSMPVIARRRLVAALGVVAAALLVAGFVVPNLPCAFPGGDRCPPDDDAIELIPSDALAYAHANLDPETEQYEAAAEVAQSTPLVSRQALGSLLPLVIGGGGLPSDFSREVSPWFGGELALALVGSRGRTQQVQLLEVDDAEGASAYADSIGAGEPTTSTYQDVEISEDERGLASAQVGGFLVLGSVGGVREIVDVSTGAEGAEALATDTIATDALDELPEHRIAEAYLSQDGLGSLAAAARSPLAPFEPFLDTGASQGAAAALSADSEGLSLATRSLLDAERSEARPGFFAAFESFEPELPADLAPDALAYLGFGEAKSTGEALLGQATARAPGIARGFADLVERLQRDAGVNLERDLLPALAGEAAFSVVPRAEGEGGEPGASLPGQTPPETLAPGAAATPFLELLAADVDEERTRDALARLQGPLSRSVDPDLGAPVFDQQKFGDVEAQVVRVSPNAQVTYALFDSKLAIASDPAGVRRAIENEGDGLEGSERYERAIGDLPDEPGLLAYLDVEELLRFGENSGLAEDTAYAAFAQDLRRLEAFAVAVGTEDGVLSADARLLIAGE